jgi:hypothetical protein
VPLVVQGPGIPAGSTQRAVVQSIDLSPTFEAWAGLPPARTSTAEAFWSCGVTVGRGRGPPQPSSSTTGPTPTPRIPTTRRPAGGIRPPTQASGPPPTPTSSTSRAIGSTTTASGTPSSSTTPSGS